MRKLLCLLLCLCVPAASPAEALSPGDRLDAMFRRYATLGACVAVFENGEITYTHCYGTQRVAGKPVTPETVFQVGSITKLVANMGLMRLLEEQGISLDEELGAVLGYSVRHPAYPNTPVTLRQLMTHTAALRDSGDYQEALMGGGRPLQTLLGKRSAYSFHARVEPGTRREYSNFGGGLIGCLIEKLSGQTVDAYMRETVFAPLGVTAAFQCPLLDSGVEVAAIVHMPQRRLAKDPREDELRVDAPNPERDYFLTAGKLLISAPDLAKLMIALCDGGIYQNTRLLKESTVSEMLTRQDYRGSVSCESGNGLFLNIIENDVVEGRTLYGHGGKAYGMLCAAYFDPVDRTGVVMLTNGCRNNSVRNNVGMLSRQILTLCYTYLISPGYADPFAVE